MTAHLVAAERLPAGRGHPLAVAGATGDDAVGRPAVVGHLAHRGPGGLLQLVRYDGRVLWSRRRSGLAFVMRADRVVYVVGSELVGVGRGGRPRR
jgi:hypothetical protein